MRRQPEPSEFIVTEVEDENGPWVGRDLFELNPEVKGWRHQLQRLCFWVLGKIGGRVPHPLITFKRIRSPIVDHDGSVLRRLEAKLNRRLVDQIWFGKAQTILMGPDTFRELMGDQDVWNDQWIAMDFATRLGLQESSGARVHQFAGVDLHIIPTMEGMLVLPGRIMADGRYSEDERRANGIGVMRSYHDPMRGPLTSLPY